MHLPGDITLCERRYEPSMQAAWRALLTDEERARLDAYTHERRRRSFLAGRAAARLLLADRLAVPPSEVPLVVAPDGAVDVPGAGLYLSISHAGDRAVAAAAPRIVGVDLEVIRPRPSDLRRFILHPDDPAVLDALPLDEARRLILCWALKEATLKALRTGFRLSPKKLRLAIDLAARTAQVEAPGGSWRLCFEERDGFYLAVAFEP